MQEDWFKQQEEGATESSSREEMSVEVVMKGIVAIVLRTGLQLMASSKELTMIVVAAGDEEVGKGHPTENQNESDRSEKNIDSFEEAEKEEQEAK